MNNDYWLSDNQEQSSQLKQPLEVDESIYVYFGCCLTFYALFKSIYWLFLREVKWMQCSPEIKLANFRNATLLCHIILCVFQIMILYKLGSDSFFLLNPLIILNEKEKVAWLEKTRGLYITYLMNISYLTVHLLHAYDFKVISRFQLSRPNNLFLLILLIFGFFTEYKYPCMLLFICSCCCELLNLVCRYMHQLKWMHSCRLFTLARFVVMFFNSCGYTPAIFVFLGWRMISDGDDQQVVWRSMYDWYNLCCMVLLSFISSSINILQLKSEMEFFSAGKYSSAEKYSNNNGVDNEGENFFLESDDSKSSHHQHPRHHGHHRNSSKKNPSHKK